MTSPPTPPVQTLPADPPVPAVEPIGPDQTERVILRAAAEDLGSRWTVNSGATGTTLVLDDATGELVAGALDRGGPVLARCTSCAATRALADRFAPEIREGRVRVLGGTEEGTDAADAGLLPHAEDGAPALGADEADKVDLVLLRLPKALAALDARARSVARELPGAVLVGGGRTKHMTRTQNEVLETSYREVHASRGIGKSRALVARDARSDVPPVPVEEGGARVAVLGEAGEVALRSVGGVFGGASADAGSLLLLEALDAARAAGEAPALESPEPGAEGSGGPRILDLGSGNGLLAGYAALAIPAARVLASDDDADAVLSSRLTLAANGLDGTRCTVAWDDAASEIPDGAMDAVLLNPPFHDGTAIDATLVHGLLDAAARVLRPGGELWFVHNSHLRYRTEVERRVGPVEQRARDRRFTVLRAVRA